MRRRAKLLRMPTCEVCENQYDKAFEVVVGGKHHTFDSFECAIHALAPVCRTAAAKSSDTAWSRTAAFIAASIAPARPAKPV